MYIIFIFAWVLSPIVLIPLCITRSKENEKLRSFVNALCRSGRISTSEYYDLRVENNAAQYPPDSQRVSGPVFADSHEFSRVHGGDSVRAEAANNTVSKGDAPAAATAAAAAASETKAAPTTAAASATKAASGTEVASVTEATAPKPAVTYNRTETDKNLYTPPVYTYRKPQDYTYAENTTDATNEKRPDDSVPKTVYRDAKPAPAEPVKNAYTPEKKRAAAMSVLMMIGIIFVVLAGLVFSTAVWASLDRTARTCVIGAVSALFFGISAFTGKKLKLERTSFAFYILGTFFSSITLITAGFFGLMGTYFSVTGRGSCLLYASALLIVSLLSANGLRIFRVPAAAYISVFSGAFSGILALVQLSDNMSTFALFAAILTAVINIFMYALDVKKSPAWERPLRIASPALNIIALLGGISAAFGNSSAFYAAAAVFVIRSAAAAVMGFRGHRIYKTRLAAVSSLGSGALFALIIMHKLSVSSEVFALSAALFAVLFSLGMFTFDIKIPEGWNIPVKMSAFILNAFGIISSFHALAENFGEWNGICFCVAGIYIISSFAAGIMAACGHRLYKNAPSAFASMFTGLAFSVMLAAELSASSAAAALYFTAMLLVLVNAFYTLPSRLPEEWKPAAGISSAVLGLISIFTSLFTFIDNFGSHDPACYTVSALYILQAVFITAAAYRGHSEYSKVRWSVISQLIGTLFSLLTLAELADSEPSFMLCLTVFAAAYLNFVHTLKLNKPEKWESSLKAFSYITGIFGMAYTLCQMLDFYEWTYHFYASAAIYIAYSIGITAMAFRGHNEYSKRHWSVISQLTGISFIFALLLNLAENKPHFMLYLTIFTVAYLNFVHTFKLNKPEKWESSLKAFSYITGIFGMAYTLCQMLDFYEWTYHFYASAAIYIAYSIGITAMAFRGHNEYSKRHWSVISQLTGISFIFALLLNLAENELSFMLYLTIFTVAYLNFVHTLKLNKPEKWESSLKTFSYITGIFGVVFTLWHWPYPFYASAAIYIAYSAGIAAMAFLRHGEYSKTHWALASQLTGMIFSLCIIYKTVDSAGLFLLIFSALAALYYAAEYFAFMKMPEEWMKVTNAVSIVSVILAAWSAAMFTADRFGDWDIYCFLIALLYIGYTAVRGIRHENSLLKAAECIISCLTACNLYCVIADASFTVPEFILVCIMLALSLIHHFAKPVRTLFSDIFLPAGLAFSALACALEYNLCGILGFAILGALMLIKAAEKDGRLSGLFKILLPLPVTGMVNTFVYWNFSDSFGTMAAASAAVLAVTAAAIMFIGKKTDRTFFSFALTSAILIFLGTSSDLTVMLLILLGASIMLTAMLSRCKNNLPSLLTMAGTAAAVRSIAENVSLRTELNVSLIFAVIFAIVSLAASRIFYGRKLLDRENECFRLDTCCTGMLLALPMVISENEKVTTFAVLAILAAFAANLVRKEHSDDANSFALTAACGLFTLALIFRPFLIVSDVLFSRKITLGIISSFGFAFSKIWVKRPKLAENFSSAVYGIAFVCLITDALSHQNLFNTLIVLAVSALILLYSFISKKKRWFAVSSIALTGLTVYTFRDFFAMIDWWVYLLIVGFILIAVSSANEYFVKKGRELKEKAGRFFEDWKW